MLYLTVLFLLLSMAQLVVSDGTRIDCPDTTTNENYQCNNDCTQLGYCDDTDNWILVLTCPAGQLCIDKGCTSSGTCPTQNWNLAVTCFDSSLKMPNVEDSTRRTYYTCQIDTGPTGTGVLQTCPTGTYFDSCSGQCNARSYPEYESCPRGNTILESNEKLAYVCTTTQIIWGTCPDGIYLNLADDGIKCYPGINYRCTNGDILSCSAAGRYPIAGTDCGFKQCYSDLSSTIIPCNTGYRYDQTRQACVVGTCTGVLPTSGCNGVNA